MIKIFRNKPKRHALIVLSIALIALLVFLLKRMQVVTTYVNHSMDSEWIVASVTNNNGKNDLWLIDSKTQKKQNIVKDRAVMTSGRINKDGDILIYSDALENEPWNVFKLNIKSKELFQVTNDSLGEFNLHFGDEKGNIIYAKSGNKDSPIPKIEKIDLTKKEGNIIDIGSDLGVEDFDIKNNKIIVLAFSYSEYVTKKLKQSNISEKILYSIIEMDMDGKNKKVISKLKAAHIDSIAFTNEEKIIVIGGEGIQGDEIGFYKLDLKKNELQTLLTEKQLQETNKVYRMSSPYIANVNYDSKKIYFSAIPTESKEKELYGINIYPNNIYSYSLENKELNEIFKGDGNFISSISITYK